MTYVFYPGCSLEGTARDFHLSTLAVAKGMGLALPEIPDWICCGSTAAHSSDPVLALALPAQNLQTVSKMKTADGVPPTVAVACAACYSRLKVANHHIANEPQTRQKVAQALGADYDGKVPVKHLLEILGRDLGPKKIAAKIRRPLKGLKVVCYYGCLLSRPPEITNFDDAENPRLMDEVMEAAGATVLDWPHKTECCGASFSITDVTIVQQLTREILSMARAVGADCIVTACPLCQLNLDMRQKEIEERYKEQYGLPVFFFSQLLGLAMGLSGQELSLRSLVVDPLPLLQDKGIAVTELSRTSNEAES